MVSLPLSNAASAINAFGQNMKRAKKKWNWSIKFDQGNGPLKKWKAARTAKPTPESIKRKSPTAKLLPLTKLGTKKKSGMNFAGHAKFYVIRASCIRSDAAKFQLKIKCACVILAFYAIHGLWKRKENELYKKCSFLDICHVRKRNCELFWYWSRHKKVNAVLTDTSHFTG